MSKLDDWMDEFKRIVPSNEKLLTSNEATFYCLQGVAYVFDKIVNTGYKDLLGVGRGAPSVQDERSNWCDINELCRRHPELRKSNVKSRQWRLDNDFPFKSEYKCRQMFYEPDVVEWINKHLRRKKC